jgi:hypothetical protein
MESDGPGEILVLFVCLARARSELQMPPSQMQARCHVHPISSAGHRSSERGQQQHGDSHGGSPDHSRQADCRAGLCVGNGARSGACGSAFAVAGPAFDRSSFTSFWASSEKPPSSLTGQWLRCVLSEGSRGRGHSREREGQTNARWMCTNAGHHARPSIAGCAEGSNLAQELTLPASCSSDHIRKALVDQWASIRPPTSNLELPFFCQQLLKTNGPCRCPGTEGA